MTDTTRLRTAIERVEDAARAEEHVLAVLIQELLREEQADARFWANDSAHREAWADLYSEHRGRLALLERLAKVGK